MEKHKKLENKTMSRRRFLSVMAGAGAVGAAATMTGCAPVADHSGKGWLPNQYRNESAMPAQVKGRVPLDPENPSLVRDDEKCILCGQCIEACEKVQSVFGFYELPVHDDFICVHCGQCSLWCPTGAIKERSAIDDVWKAIQDPSTTVVVQTSPATRVGIGEEFGMGAGAWAEGQMVTALRKLGFDVVVDTNFSADLTIMEEGSELVSRVTGGGVLPQMTSCCPGWVKFVEYYYPELIPHLSSARSPMMMHGSTLKTYNAKKLGVDYKKVINVAIMPCLAKKFEITRHQFHGLEGGTGKYFDDDEVKDMDYVLSVRELANMIRQKLGDIDFANLAEGKYDQIGSTAGLIFGNTGGVMEAAIRSAYFLLTGSNPPAGLYDLQPVRGLDGIKRATVEVPGVGPIKVVVASGLANARQLCEEIKSGKADFHFMEIMACPGGCIAGGGQPRTAVPPQDWVRQARIDNMYHHDEVGSVKGTAKGDAAGQEKLKNQDSLRLCHENPHITEIYDEFLEAPLSHLAHELCHTTYEDRSSHITRKEV